MKKIKGIISLAIVTILFINIICVKAIDFDIYEPKKDPFIAGWKTDPKSILKIKNIDLNSEEQNISVEALIGDNNYPFNKGYIVTDLTFKIDNNNVKFGTDLLYVDRDGKTKKNTFLDNEIILNMRSNSEYLYSISYKVNLNELQNTGAEIKENLLVKKYDKDLNIIREIDILDNIKSLGEESNGNYALSIIINTLPKLLGYDILGINDGNLIIFSGYQDFIIIDEELKDITLETMNEENLQEYFPVISTTIKLLQQTLAPEEPEEGTDGSEGDASEEESTNQNELLIIHDLQNEYRASSGITVGNEKELDLNHGLVVPEMIIDKVSDQLNGEPSENEPENIDPYEDFLTLDSKIALYQNEELVWEKVNKDYLFMFNTKFVGDYIVTIGLKVKAPIGLYDESFLYEILDNELQPSNKRWHEIISEFILEFNVKTDILVYDKRGELVQTITDGSIHTSLVPSESGFITSSLNGLPEILGVYKHIVDNFIYEGEEKTIEISEEVLINILNYMIEILEEVPIRTNHKTWYIKSDIKVFVEGKGQIEVIENSTMGEYVEFKVIPKEGYVLSKIHITDANGNVVTYTGNTFTMPSHDVTIEAEFKRVSNPATSTFAIIGIILITLISLYFIITNRKKADWLK